MTIESFTSALSSSNILRVIILIMKIISFTSVLLFLSPTFSLAQSQNAAALTIYQEAGAVITTMVQANSRLTPEFLRMGFHDCIGGCDGT
jgi:hypothetical protein